MALSLSSSSVSLSFLGAEGQAFRQRNLRDKESCLKLLSSVSLTGAFIAFNNSHFNEMLPKCCKHLQTISSTKGLLLFFLLSFPLCEPCPCILNVLSCNRVTQKNLEARRNYVKSNKGFEWLLILKLRIVPK